MGNLIEALFAAHGIEEAEELFPRYRDAAKELSGQNGSLCYDELNSLIVSAQLHEVMRICTLCWEPLHTARDLHSTKTHSICHGFHYARILPVRLLKVNLVILVQPRHMHSLNLLLSLLSPGTRKAPRG